MTVDTLVKTYAAPGGGPFNAVDGVSFDVRRGELFGFLGPNGAGKTTTLEILEGIREPTSGGASVLGLDVVREREELKRRIGVQLQAGAYFSYLTLEEILILFGSFTPADATRRSCSGASACSTSAAPRCATSRAGRRAASPSWPR